jgi:hypothetical protein
LPAAETLHNSGVMRSQKTLPAQLFSSRLSTLKKRQSVPSVMILVGVDLIMPDSCNRSE